MPEETLRPFDERHVAERVRWLSHDQVRAGVPIQGELTVESTLLWTERISADPNRVDFVLEDADGSALVMCGVTGIEQSALRGEVYMFADPDRQGLGHGSSALRLLCRRAFLELGLNRIFLYTMGSNEAARRFYERQGFIQEGCLRQHAWHRGVREDRYVHALLKNEWEKLQ